MFTALYSRKYNSKDSNEKKIFRKQQSKLIVSISNNDKLTNRKNIEKTSKIFAAILLN